jgi:hypothetical protein
MILDAENRFSNAQALTATANSDNVLDLGLAGRDIGAGEVLYIVVVVTTAFTDSGSDSTITVTLVTDDNSSLSSVATLATLGVFPALSAVGARIVYAIPPGLAFERYIALAYTATGGSLTTGAVTAVITKDVDAYKSYAANYNIA